MNIEYINVSNFNTIYYKPDTINARSFSGNYITNNTGEKIYAGAHYACKLTDGSGNSILVGGFSDNKKQSLYNLVNFNNVGISATNIKFGKISNITKTIKINDTLETTTNSRNIPTNIHNVIEPLNIILDNNSRYLLTNGNTFRKINNVGKEDLSDLIGVVYNIDRNNYKGFIKILSRW